MIKICSLTEIEKYNYRDVFYYRILSDFNLYGNDFPFSSFYSCFDGEEIVSLISKIDGVITVSCIDERYKSEITEFCKITGFKTILADNNIFSSCRHGDILKFKGEILNSDALISDSEILKDVYNILKKSFDDFPAFESWFPDISYRLRHFAGRLAVKYYEGEIVSCAFSLFESENSFVISSVATEKECRCRGFAKECIYKLLKDNKNIFVFTENKELTDLYKSMGFAEYGKWSETNCLK